MLNRLTDVVKHLLIINVIVFVAFFILFPEYKSYISLYYPASDSFLPFQLVTHMFMHGGLQHLLFNMLSLFFLGPMVEQALGSKRFLIFYLICGIGAMLAHLGIDYFTYIRHIDQLPMDLEIIKTEGRSLILSGRNYSDLSAGTINRVFNIPMVGASGAIMGVFIAFGLLFPDVKLMLLFPPIPIKAKYLMLGLIAFDLFSGIGGMNTGIAHFAHLGGAITGFLIMAFWKKVPFLR